MADQPELGVVLKGDEGRDAIHIAIVPVIAAQRLCPGDWVRFSDDGERVCITTSDDDRALGVIDPYLPEITVEKGQRCWLFLKPRTITSLRHVWTHPNFTDEAPRVKPTPAVQNEHLAWLQRLAEQHDITYDTLMTAALTWIETGESYCFYGTSDHYVPEEFWDHYDAVMNTKTPSGRRDNFFTCSC